MKQTRTIEREKKFIPNDDRTVKWGKYKGLPMSKLLTADDDYLRWLLLKTEPDFARYEKQYLGHNGIEIV